MKNLEEADRLFKMALAKLPNDFSLREARLHAVAVIKNIDENLRKQSHRKARHIEENELKVKNNQNNQVKPWRKYDPMNVIKILDNMISEEKKKLEKPIEPKGDINLID
jgi:hypothetical protein